MKLHHIAAAVFILSGVPAAAQEASFCERLAPQLGMIPIEKGRQGQTTGEWRVNTLAGLKTVLFGGSTLVSFGMQPAGDSATVEDYARLQKACEQQKKNFLCRIEGPMILTVSTGKGKAEIEALPGERAEVEMKGTTILCRDPRAMKNA